MYNLQWKIKHNKIDKGGEGEEGGFKPQAIMFKKWSQHNIKPVNALSQNILPTIIISGHWHLVF